MCVCTCVFTLFISIYIHICVCMYVFMCLIIYCIYLLIYIFTYLIQLWNPPNSSNQTISLGAILKGFYVPHLKSRQIWTCDEAELRVVEEANLGAAGFGYPLSTSVSFEMGWWILQFIKKGCWLIPNKVCLQIFIGWCMSSSVFVGRWWPGRWIGQHQLAPTGEVWVCDLKLKPWDCQSHTLKYGKTMGKP